MAARLNTKFILILFIILASCALALGGLWTLKKRTDSTRHIRRGDEFMQKGDFRMARKFYGRGIGKEPSNLEYLGFAEGALLAITPETSDESDELYRAKISLYKHAATHHPLDAAKHLRLIHELHTAARRMNFQPYTKLLEEAADDMWNALPPGNPDRIEAKLYRGLARFNSIMFDRMTDEEIDAGEQDLRDYVAERPESDAAWAALVQGRLWLMQQADQAGLATRMEEMLLQARQDLQQGRTHVPNGPQLTVARLQMVLHGRARNPESGDEGEIRAATQALRSGVVDAESTWLVAQAASALEVFAKDGAPDSVELLDEVIAKAPEAYDLQLQRATLLFRRGDFEPAQAAATAVMESEQLPVGLTSHIQHELRRRAASLNVDIAARRWNESAPVDQEAMYAAVVAARDNLLEHVSDQENDPLLLRANGKVAYSAGDHAQAAALFNRLVSERAEVDFETLMYAAISLEKQGEIGAALERIDSAIAQQPNNTNLMLHQAGLRMRVGHYVEASELVDRVLAIEPQDAIGLDLKQEIAKRLTPDDPNSPDPVRTAIRSAEADFRAGDYDGSRATLLAAFAKYPDDLLLLNALIRIEMADDNTDQARVYLDRGLELVPRSQTFLQLKSFLENPDAIGRIKQYVAEIFPNDVDQTAEILLSMRQLAERQAREAVRLEAAGLPTEAAEAAALAERAGAEVGPYLAKIQELAPDHKRYIEYRFLDAVSQSDWEALDAVVADATRLNTDQAEGALFEGRAAAARNDPVAAVRAFQRATEATPYSATAWRLLGMAYQEVGNVSEAVRAFERSYTNNPNDIRTVRRYATLLGRSGNTKRALLVVKDARRLAPADPELRERWLVLEQQVGDQAVALRERRRIYNDWQVRISSMQGEEQEELRQNEDAWRNASALAAILGTTDPKRELIFDDKGVAKYTSEQWSRLRAVEQQQAVARAKAGWFEEADQIVETLGSGNPDLRWHMLKADLLRAKGDALAGETMLREFGSRQDDAIEKTNALLALGMYQAQLNRTKQAIETFTEAQTHQRVTARRADRALGELYFKLRRYDEALPHINAVIEVAPTDRLHMQAVEVLVNLGRYDEARTRLDEFEGSGGRSTNTLLLRAQVVKGEGENLLRDGQVAEAQTRFDEYERVLEQVKRLDPTDPFPYALRATRLLHAAAQTNNTQLLDEALSELGLADEIEADFPRTHQVRAAVLQAQGDMRGAMNELERVIELTPGDDQSRTLLVRLLASEGRVDDALAMAHDAVQLKPSSSVWLEAVGDLYTVKLNEARDSLEGLKNVPVNARVRRDQARLQAEIRELRATIEEYQTKALGYSPSLPLLVKRAEALLGYEPPKAAEAVALVETYSDKLVESPLLRSTYARALDLNGRVDEGAEQMRLSYAQYKDYIVRQARSPGVITNWYAALQRMYGEGRPAQAEALAMELASPEPNTYEFRSLGNIWRESGKGGMDRAIELYQRAIDVCPEDERAFKTRLYADLGLCLLLTNQFQRALVVFEQVLELDPDHGEALNNLAYLLAETMGDPARALPYAERAAEVRSDDWSVLDTIGWIYFRLAQYDEAESMLRRSSQIKETAVNQVHLAELYVKQSDFTRAQRYLERATELRPDSNTQREIDRLTDDIRTSRGRGG